LPTSCPPAMIRQMRCWIFLDQLIICDQICWARGTQRDAIDRIAGIRSLMTCPVQISDIHIDFFIMVNRLPGPWQGGLYYIHRGAMAGDVNRLVGLSTGFDILLVGGIHYWGYGG
jgi:hypothetical protein